MPTYTCTRAAQSLELLCTCILERLWCLIKGQSWIIYQGFGGNIPYKNTPYWGMIDKIFQHFRFWIELYSYSNVFFCLCWKTCSIDHVRGNLCIHIWQQKPRITIRFKCSNLTWQPRKKPHPLANGSSSFFFLLSAGSDFLFTYFINLDSSCSNATKTGLSCLVSKQYINSKIRLFQRKISTWEGKLNYRLVAGLNYAKWKGKVDLKHENHTADSCCGPRRL